MTNTRSRISGCRAGVALLSVLVIMAICPKFASAHAFLDTSSPPANAVVKTAPAEVVMTFTERVQPSASKAQLFNSDAERVDTPSSHMGATAYELILPLPKNLPTGTYTVQWQNVSAEDGHPNSGYFAFTVGGAQNVVLPAPPPAPSNSGSIMSLASLARWLGLLGLAALAGTVLIWRWVIAPAIAGCDPEEISSVARQARRVVRGGVGMAVVGSVLFAAAQAQSTGGLSLASMWDVIAVSRFGHLLIIRDLLAFALGVVAWRADAWTAPTARTRWLTLTLAAALPVPYALNSHAAAETTGRQTAIVADWLHLTAASVWIGGLLAVAIALIYVRSIARDKRVAIYAEAIPRISTIAIVSVVLLALTGFYAAWLQVGNLTSLFDTSYGHTLIVKLLTLVPLLLLGAVNLLVIGPRIRQGRPVARHFKVLVTGEVALGIAILAVTAVLTGLPTSREVTTFSSGHPAFQFDQNGIRAALQIYPGTVGINSYTADIQSHNAPLSAGSQVFVRFTSNGQLSGQQQVELRQLTGSKTRYTAQGTQLSVVGSWTIDLVVREPNKPDWDVSTGLKIAKIPLAERAPGLPLRFMGYSPALGLLIAAAGVLALVVGLRKRPDNVAERRFTTEAGVSAIAAGALILFLSRAPGMPSSAGNPIPKTAESIAIGRSLFLQHCVECHGSDAHGDGPLASQLNPPPADLYAAHVDYHTDMQLFDWIKGGISGSAMPGFKGQMTDQEIWNVVNYVRSLRHPYE